MTEKVIGNNGMQIFTEAKVFWSAWHDDPNSDMKYAERNPNKVIEAHLIDNFGAHAIEAAWVSNAADIVVIEALELKNESQ